MVYKKLFWLLLLTGTLFVLWQKWGQSLAFIFFASRIVTSLAIGIYEGARLNPLGTFEFWLLALKRHHLGL